MSTDSTKKHFYWLNWLRFLAALSVMFVHVRGLAFVDFGSLPDQQKTVFMMGFYGLTRIGLESVIVFFVISGFLVLGMAIERIQKKTFNFGDYLLDRAVRILLPLIPALVLSGLIAYVLDIDIYLSVFMGNIFGLQNVFFSSFGGNAPLWSLAYETWFYMLIGIAGLMVVKANHKVVYLILFTMVLSVFVQLNPIYLFCWGIGGIAYLVKPKEYSPRVLILAVVLILFSAVGSQYTSESKSVSVVTFNSFIFTQDFMLLYLAMGMALFIQQLVVMKPQKAWLVALEAYGSKLSAFSYTLYLVHYPIVLLIFKKWIPNASTVNFISILTFVGVSAICLGVSVLFYLMFEKHTYGVKKKIKIMFYT
ncbi:acyltransferase family protein [Magnetococcus sp. PR-3]|uniref:acyltransferase family protein n=1 Tax=Magnetococcus sp. PR-3 TaxID=3120355 RepID=UPI002FCE1420